MPNRIIKESTFTSDKIAQLSDFEFRLWVGLITQADDAGRGDARPAIIKGRVFALRERTSLKDIENALSALAAHGCVSLYTVDGKPYYEFPHWAAHQRVRNAVTKYPGIDESDNSPQLAATRGDSPQLAARIQSNPIQSESESECVTRAREKIPPEHDEAAAYYAEKGFTFGLDKWFAKYEANGWRVGRDKMKSWKGSMRYWQSLENDKPGKKPMQETARGVDSDAEIDAKIARMKQMNSAGGK